MYPIYTYMAHYCTVASIKGQLGETGSIYDILYYQNLHPQRSPIFRFVFVSPKNTIHATRIK